MPVLATVMRLVASVTPAFGVNVAVNVRSPSLDDTGLRVPLAIVRSRLLKPLTVSVNVKVTSEVSPTRSAVSSTMTTTFGRTVSMA